MLRYRRLEQLPQNFSEFIDEIAPELEALYGEAAAQDYRQTARRAMSANIVHPSVQAFGAYHGAEVVGMSIAIDRAPAAEIGFVHVLRSHAGGRVEARLVREATAHLRAIGAESVVSECIPVADTDLSAAFEPQGFNAIRRALMQLSLEEHASPCETEQISPLQPAQWRAAARCIADAYRDSPDRMLHVEVSGVESAYDYISRIASGNYGPVLPGFLRAIWREEECLGVILGCRSAPGTGFILQVVVRPEARGEGIGCALLSSLLGAFGDAGFRHAALGVTQDNPAMRLYERLGFTTIREVNAYVWHANGA